MRGFCLNLVIGGFVGGVLMSAVGEGAFVSGVLSRILNYVISLAR